MTAVDSGFGALLRQTARVLQGDEQAWERFLAGLPGPVRRAMLRAFFEWQAHGGQEAPPMSGPGSDWTIWLMMAGRGFGKTRAGAEWVCARAREAPGARIALIGASVDEVAKVMIEGPSGLFAVSADEEEMLWVPTQGTVTFAGGAQAFVYSAAAAEKLRGPEHDFAWADELAKWEQADSALDNLMMGLRRGERPRLVVTTTPRAVAALRRLRLMPGVVETGGGTAQNMHLAAGFKAWVEGTYGGTRLGRQELDGILFDEPEGALFPRELLEASRQSGTLPREARGEGRAAESLPFLKRHPGADPGFAGDPFWRRVVVGVDPPASASGDACGIVVCGLGGDGAAYVLADCSVRGERPEGWARAVARAAAAWEADRVIAEKNQGGDMVGSVLRSVDAALPVKLVSATRGKVARAEPVAAWMESGRVRLAGRFPELEDELAGLQAGGSYEGPGRSPDRADAMVWALTALMPVAEPRVLGL